MAYLVESTLKNIILGRKEFILSRTEYKRILLTGQLSLIAFIVCVAYLFFDLSTDIFHVWPYQTACALLTLLTFWLNRLRKYTAAKLLFCLTINITVFLFASAEPVQTGVFMFHISTSLAAFAIFGYEERVKALGMVALSMLLFFISLHTNLRLLPHVPQDDEYIQTNLIINFTVCTLSSALIIYFLIKINYYSEAALKENEIKITEQNNELIKINGELDRFVYSTSHDIRAPLSSIQGLINLTDMSENLPEIKSYISMMKLRLAHLDNFISDISDYSRNSRVDVSKTKIPVKKLLYDVLENLRFYPHSEKIIIELNVDDDLIVFSDSMRLQIVLTNLISNAFKYHDPAKAESHIHISTSSSKESFIELEIRDNGIGIPAELLPRIFDMFFQAHERSKGSGLGLYIVKETLQKLGGTIAVQSKVGEGAAFTIRLPKN